MNSVELDHVVIAVSDWDRSNRFYRDLLGAELVELTRGRWAYRLANAQLNVHGPGSTPAPRAAHPVQPGNSDLCVIWAGSIAGAVEHLRAHGIEIEEGPVARTGARGEGTSVYFRDPDGSVEAVFQGPEDAVELLVEFCREGPPGARVDDVEVTDEEPEPTPGFSVR